MFKYFNTLSDNIQNYLYILNTIILYYRLFPSKRFTLTIKYFNDDLTQWYNSIDCKFINGNVYKLYFHPSSVNVKKVAALITGCRFKLEKKKE